MDYEQLRLSYKPTRIKWLFIAESPPPEAKKTSTRHFYRDQGAVEGDRLFTNTIKALYPDAAESWEADITADKVKWLQRFRADGCYMVEALTESVEHGTSPAERKQLLKATADSLMERLRDIVDSDTKIIVIKSTTYQVLAEELRTAGFNIINQAVLDYPGFWREQAYRQKLRQLMAANGWHQAGNGES